MGKRPAHCRKAWKGGGGLVRAAGFGRALEPLEHFVFRNFRYHNWVLCVTSLNSRFDLFFDRRNSVLRRKTPRGMLWLQSRPKIFMKSFADMSNVENYEAIYWNMFGVKYGLCALEHKPFFQDKIFE